MAGIYIHIPFCKTRCIYCGFYSTTYNDIQSRYVDAVLKELELRSDYINEPIETIYLGGGTPSQLHFDLIEQLISNLTSRADVARHCKEITIECNPDDVNDELAALFRRLGVNRISMGVQTFSDERLRFIRRRHTAEQAHKAVDTLRKAGIKNISIDLMFGFPDETMDEWIGDIDTAISLGVEHISAYSLMYEEGTPLFSMLERGEIKEIDEELSRRMYYALIDRLTASGYFQYEISNFARESFRSRHNSSYWRAVPYIGLGAGAHSYDGHSRQWNIDNIYTYIYKVENGTIPYEREELDAVTRYNDMITTALRTREGIEIKEGGFYDYMMVSAKKLVSEGLLAVDNGHLHLTRKGLYVSDDIMAELIKA